MCEGNRKVQICQDSVIVVLFVNYQFNWTYSELTERGIKISTSRMVGRSMEGLVGFSEGLSTDPTPNSSQNAEEKCDFSRPHLFVLAVLMTL